MNNNPILPDIKPETPEASLDRTKYVSKNSQYALSNVARVVGMSETFIKKVCGSKKELSTDEVLYLLDQDSFRETFIPRSKVLDYLEKKSIPKNDESLELGDRQYLLKKSHALDAIKCIPEKTIQCVVTSTPYWGLRIYKDPHPVQWADGEISPYGHEQTPEGFLRHTTEILAALWTPLRENGSIWWNVMDSFNTRTQIRNNAVEALRAMQGKDSKSWKDHDCRRYSAGHSYLKDGEQCILPGIIAQRASQIGYYVKSVITWAKTATTPEPQNSRVSRNIEYVLHLTKIRTPLFGKEAYRSLPAALGGRNNGQETDKLSDIWTLSTSSGRDGHGAQFPLALPARCIGLTTNINDIVLDPFVGAGTSGIAALMLGRRFIGVDVSQEYLATASRLLSEVKSEVDSTTKNNDQLETLESPRLL